MTFFNSIPSLQRAIEKSGSLSAMQPCLSCVCAVCMCGAGCMHADLKSLTLVIFRVPLPFLLLSHAFPRTINRPKVKSCFAMMFMSNGVDNDSQELEQISIQSMITSRRNQGWRIFYAWETPHAGTAAASYDSGEEQAGAAAAAQGGRKIMRQRRKKGPPETVAEAADDFSLDPEDTIAFFPTKASRSARALPPRHTHTLSLSFSFSLFFTHTHTHTHTYTDT